MAKITGADSVKKRLAGLAGAEKIELVGKALFAGGEMLKAEAQRLITAGSVSGKNHVASAPGQPPHNDTGHLKNGIIVTQIGPLHVRVISTAVYSAIHEFGGSINHPGGTAFFKGKEGDLIFVSNATAERYAAKHGRQMPRTKPHIIPMPARPFMGPAARRTKPDIVKLVGSAVDIAVKRGR